MYREKYENMVVDRSFKIEYGGKKYIIKENQNSPKIEKKKYVNYSIFGEWLTTKGFFLNEYLPNLLER